MTNGGTGFEGGQRAAWALVLLVLGVYAYSPLWSDGFVGQDYPTLSVARELAHPGPADSATAAGQSGAAAENPSEAGPGPGGAEPASRGRIADLALMYRVPGTHGRPLAALSLTLSTLLHAQDGHWLPSGVRALRLENLILLILAAIGAAFTVRRGLLPWTGEEQARAAAVTAAAFLLLHPLSVSSVARVASRGDLLALAIGTWATAAFLKGRQERKYSLLIALAPMAFLMGAAARVAYVLPFALAGLEYCSARRHRSMAMRFRTASTTFFVFGFVVFLERVLRMVLRSELGVAEFLQEDRVPHAFAGEDSPLWGFAFLFEKLGVLMLPVNPHGMMGVIGYALAALFVLAAVQPAFLAARAAPRLWGGLLLGWFLMVLVALLQDADLRVTPHDLDRGHALLAAALISAVGFGIACTALSGLRRQVVPLILCVIYALLAHAVALPWGWAGVSVENLRAEIAGRAQRNAGVGTFYVIDAPRRIAGIDALDRAIPRMLESTFSAGSGGRAGESLVRSMTSAAFYAFAQTAEFGQLRGSPLELVFPPGTLEVAGEKLDRSQPIAIHAIFDHERNAVWRNEGRTPANLVMDSILYRALRVVALPETDRSQPPLLEWSARSELLAKGSVQGIWLDGERGPLAWFDLARVPGWVLGDRITTAWFGPSLSRLSSAEVLMELPSLEIDSSPVVDGEDWIFALPAANPEPPVGAETGWTLGLLDLAGLQYLEIEGRIAGSRLRFDDVQELLDRAAARRAGPIVWTLEERQGALSLRGTTGRWNAPQVARGQ